MLKIDTTLIINGYINSIVCRDYRNHSIEEISI